MLLSLSRSIRIILDFESYAVTSAESQNKIVELEMGNRFPVRYIKHCHIIPLSETAKKYKSELHDDACFSAFCIFVTILASSAYRHFENFMYSFGQVIGCFKWL